MAKKDTIIREVLNIIDSFDMKLILRQIHYRLVENSKFLSDLNYPNTHSQYKTLSRNLVEARKNGRIPIDAIVDKTRNIRTEIWRYYNTWKNSVYYKIKGIKSAPSISINKNLYQEKICVILLEKQALESIFERIMGNSSILVVSRGYNSFSQIYELSQEVKNENRELNLYTFSDMDSSGIDIERNFIEQTQEIGITWNSIKRMALTKQQIDDYGLPYAPPKKKDSRTKKYLANGFKGAIELDALNPNILTDLIRECLAENWNETTEKYRRNLQKTLNRRAKKLYAKKLMKTAQDLIDEAD